MMKVNILAATTRSLALEMENDSCYRTEYPYTVKVNGKIYRTDQTENVFSVYQLIPDTEYRIEVENETDSGFVMARTKKETAFINAKRFGLTGDGKTEDTAKLQAAMMACPAGGTVYVPAGNYLCYSLFLPGDITLYLDQGCTILGGQEREKFPILPGVIPTTDEEKEFYLGSWEGNPLDCFAGLINIIGRNNTVITGQGVIDAQAWKGDWYVDAKKKKIAWRPRLFFTSHASNVLLHGVKVQNSYSWTLHPMFSENVDIIDVTVHNPSDSPNTDGLDVESCRNMRIIGNRFSVGDDCIVLKSGKLYMGRLFKQPAENLEIRNCLLSRGHGGLVLGSEMSGGIKNVHMTKCIMDHTDRGLRIKSRRGRGRDAIVSNLVFNQVEMDHVLTPFAINMFYECDPDGKTDYVQSRKKAPVNDKTPYLGALRFENIRSVGATCAGCYFLGLPEQPIGSVTMENVSVKFSEDSQKGVPVMACGVEPVSKLAFRAEYVTEIQLKNVSFEGYEGEKIQLKEVGSFKEEEI